MKTSIITFPKKPKKFSFVEFKEEYLKDELIKNTNFMSKFREICVWMVYSTRNRKINLFTREIIGKGCIQSNAQTLFVPSIPYKIKVIVKSKEKNIHIVKTF